MIYFHPASIIRVLNRESVERVQSRGLKLKVYCGTHEPDARSCISHYKIKKKIELIINVFEKQTNWFAISLEIFIFPYVHRPHQTLLRAACLRPLVQSVHLEIMIIRLCIKKQHLFNVSLMVQGSVNTIYDFWGPSSIKG